MPRKPPPEHSRFKPGVSGNPGGTNKLSPLLKAIKPLSTDELKRTISLHFRLTFEELEKIDKDPRANALDRILVAAMLHSIKTGDIYKAEALFMRCLGKVTEKIELKHPEPVVIERPTGETVTLDVQSTSSEVDE